MLQQSILKKIKVHAYVWRSAITGITLFIGGLIFSFFSDPIFLGIGTSLMASGLVFFVSDCLTPPMENPLKKWNLKKIYLKRSDKSADFDPALDKVKTNIDVIAFGLKHFRTSNQQRIEDCLKRGVQIRILTMDPNSPFVKTRALEEDGLPEQIQLTIKQLIAWAKELNEKGFAGTITIKGYSSMPLDFYWRCDDYLFIGPYWYKLPSSNTITYMFEAGGLGFDTYSKYFEKLWDDSNLSTVLVEQK